jgi:hypothetical protein
MPLSYEIDTTRRLVVATASGALTQADVVGYQKEVWSRPEVAGFDEIVDMSSVTSLVVSTERVQLLAALSASMDAPSSRSRFAIVAPADHHFGIGRMYQTYRDANPQSTKQIGVFRSRVEAHAWLGLEDSGPPASAAKKV